MAHTCTYVFFFCLNGLHPTPSLCHPARLIAPRLLCPPPPPPPPATCGPAASGAAPRAGRGRVCRWGGRWAWLARGAEAHPEAPGGGAEGGWGLHSALEAWGGGCLCLGGGREGKGRAAVHVVLQRNLGTPGRDRQQLPRDPIQPDDGDLTFFLEHGSSSVKRRAPARHARSLYWPWPWAAGVCGRLHSVPVHCPASKVGTRPKPYQLFQRCSCMHAVEPHMCACGGKLAACVWPLPA